MSESCAARPAPVPGARLIVGVGDMQHTAYEGLLVTYALGSCIGVTVHDPVAGVGALLHAMLPEPGPNEDAGERSPLLFVDLGVPAMFRACYELGLQKQRARICVAGGACLRSDPEHDVFQIGRKNVEMLDRLLKINGIWLSGRDIGGALARNMILDVASGEVFVETAKGRTTL